MEFQKCAGTETRLNRVVRLVTILFAANCAELTSPSRSWQHTWRVFFSIFSAKVKQKRERCDALQSEREVVERKEYEAVLAMSLLDTHKNIAQICIKSSLSSSHSRQTSDVKSIIPMKLRDNTEHVLKVYME